MAKTKLIDLDDETRKELIEYYKWVVNLSSLILTVTISIVSLDKKDANGQIILGWCFCLLSIFFNWTIIKKLVTVPIFEKIRLEDMGPWHRLWLAGLSHLSLYGTIQNTSLLVGFAFLIYGFLK